MENLKEKIYLELEKEAAKNQDFSLEQAFLDHPARSEEMFVDLEGTQLDFSKSLVTKEVFAKLLFYAELAGLSGAMHDMFGGKKINRTENRAVLHTALRDFQSQELVLDGENLMPMIAQERERMLDKAEKVYLGQYKNANHEPYNQIVNIGIGGSDLGPKMAVTALEHYGNPKIESFFISNVDPVATEQVLKQLNPARCIFILASKTFTTLETMTNAKLALDWYNQALGDKAKPAEAFFALSSAVEKARQFGILTENIFPMWDWVGGRYSLPSSIGFSLACRIGKKHFLSLLHGMEKIDQHFKTAPYNKNIPVILALLGFWYRNFLKLGSLAILPYSEDLRLFPSYLNQLEMESNGKSVDQEGQRVLYPTCPVIFGGAGTDSQHSFFQLLHQGSDVIPADFIGFQKSTSGLQQQHAMLMANFIAQQQALAFGRKLQEVEKQEKDKMIQPFKVFKGNRPSNCLVFPKLSPSSLGELIAIYEHKVFTQGVLWNIFSFDQWGVELGKELANKVQKIWSGELTKQGLDPSSLRWIEYFRP